MKLFICVDDEGGMTFMGRRVSRDRIVVEDVAAASGEALTVFPFSERLFKDAGYSPRIVPCGTDVADSGCLFLEDRSPKSMLDRVDTLVIYRWNRLYPSDKKIDFCPLEEGFSLIQTVDMTGKSHEKITKEIYKR